MSERALTRELKPQATSGPRTVLSVIATSSYAHYDTNNFFCGRRTTRVSPQVLPRREDEEVFSVFLLAGEVDVKITQAE